MSKKDATRKRRNFLERVFGKDTGNSVDAAMLALQAALDNGGVVSKEYDSEKVKGVLEKLQDSFRKPLAQLTDDEELVTRLANEFLAQAMGAISEIGNAVNDASIADDDEEELLPEELRQLTKQVNALSRESMDVYGEMKEFVPAFIKVADTVEKLAPLATKAKEFEGLEGRIAALELSMSQAPRSASAAPETVIENEKVKKTLQGGTENIETVLGIRVRGET